MVERGVDHQGGGSTLILSGEGSASVRPARVPWRTYGVIYQGCQRSDCRSTARDTRTSWAYRACTPGRVPYGDAMGLRIGALVVDSQDPGRLARFWAEALGWVISQAEDPEWVVEPPEGSREDCVVADLLFIKVPESKTGKNRLHLDLRPEDQSAEIARLEGLGATSVDVGQGNNQTWVVMADPEGNEFCVQHAHPPPIRTQWLQRYEAYQPVHT